MDKRGPGRPRKMLPIYFEEVVGDYLVWMRSRPRKRCKESSVRVTRIRIGHVRNFLGETFDLRALSDEDMSSFVAKREDEDRVSGKTINHELTALGGLFRYIQRVKKLWTSPPVQLVDFRFDATRLKKPSITVLTDDEFGRLIRAARAQRSSQGAPPERTALVIAIAFYAGLRHAEIAHLWRRDVDLALGTIAVSRKPHWTPKDYEEREIPMHPDLIRLFEEYFKLNEQSYAESWVFEGYGMNAKDNFLVEVKEAFQRAGLGDRKRRPGLHSLRRTWATNLLAKTKDLVRVMELGGWATIESVQRYLTSSKDSHRSAINTLPSVIDNAPAQLKSAPAPTEASTSTIDLIEALVKEDELSYEQAVAAVKRMQQH